MRGKMDAWTDTGMRAVADTGLDFRGKIMFFAFGNEHSLRIQTHFHNLSSC